MRLGTLIAIIIVLGGGAAGFYFYKRNLGDGSESGSEGDSAPEGASEAQQEDPTVNFGIDEAAKYIAGYTRNQGNKQDKGSDKDKDKDKDKEEEDKGEKKFVPDPQKEFFVNKLALSAIPVDDSEKIRRTADYFDTKYRTEINRLTNFRRKEIGLTPGGQKLPRRQQSLGLALAFLYQGNYIDASTAKKVGKNKIKNFMGWWTNTPRISQGYPGGPLRSYFPADRMKKIRRHRQARLAAGSGSLTG